jgi:hypothetical protein
LPGIKCKPVHGQLLLKGLLAQPTTPHTQLCPGAGGQNIAYDLALVKLGPHTKFGEDWSNGVDFYTGHTHTNTHTHTQRFNFIYKIAGVLGNIRKTRGKCMKLFMTIIYEFL